LESLRTCFKGSFVAGLYQKSSNRLANINQSERHHYDVALRRVAIKLIRPFQWFYNKRIS